MLGALLCWAVCGLTLYDYLASSKSMLGMCNLITTIVLFCAGWVFAGLFLIREATK